MAVYGDMLNYFSELFQNFEYFSMKPRTVSSYTERQPLGKVRGVFQFMKRGELKGENDTLADVDVPTLWTKKELKVGDYFIQVEDVTYRIVKSSDWSFSGGFHCYILETVVGSIDTQKPFDNVNLGQHSYG